MLLVYDGLSVCFMLQCLRFVKFFFALLRHRFTQICKIEHAFFPPANRHGNSFGGVCLCVYVCNTVIFESLDVESSFLVYWYNFKGYRSLLYMKVIRSRSRSQDQKIGSYESN